MADTELAVVNLALFAIGDKTLASLSGTSKVVTAANALYAQARDEVFEMPDNWEWATSRTQLELLYRLTVDTAPSPAAWAADATLTGATSGATCTVVAVISDTVYLVTEPSDDFTDGEVISDGANSVDCATDYPEVEEEDPDSGYAHQYVLPSNYVRTRAMVDEGGDEVEYQHKREMYFNEEGDDDVEIEVMLTDQATCYVKYIRRRTDPSTWPAWFTRLVYLNLALTLCPSLTGDKKKKRNLLQEWWEAALVVAREANGMEGAETDGAGVNLDYGNNDVVGAAGESTLRDLPPNYD